MMNKMDIRRRTAMNICTHHKATHTQGSNIGTSRARSSGLIKLAEYGGLEGLISSRVHPFYQLF